MGKVAPLDAPVGKFSTHSTGCLWHLLHVRLFPSLILAFLSSHGQGTCHFGALQNLKAAA